jgi:hypothetical protein
LFGTDLLHKIQLSFKSGLPNIPSFSSSASKNGEVGPNFIVFMKQQKRCFTNKIFKLTHEVGHKLPAIATVYIKMVRSVATAGVAAHGGDRRGGAPDQGRLHGEKRDGVGEEPDG